MNTVPPNYPQHFTHYAPDHSPLDRGDGEINVLAAVNYGFARWASRSNWLTWGLLLVAPAVLIFVLTFVLIFFGEVVPVRSDAADNLSFALMAVLIVASVVLTTLVNLWIYRGGVVQAAEPSIRFRDFYTNARVGHQLLLIVGVVTVALALIFPIGLLFELAKDSPKADVLLLLGLIVLPIVLAPFFFLVPYFIADGSGVFEAIGDNIQAGRQHWLALLVYCIVEIVLSQLIIGVTFGFGILAVVPLSAIIRGHLVRQFNCGYIPVGTNG